MFRSCSVSSLTSDPRSFVLVFDVQSQRLVCSFAAWLWWHWMRLWFSEDPLCHRWHSKHSLIHIDCATPQIQSSDRISCMRLKISFHLAPWTYSQLYIAVPLWHGFSWAFRLMALGCLTTLLPNLSLLLAAETTAEEYFQQSPFSLS